VCQSYGKETNAHKFAGQRMLAVSLYFKRSMVRQHGWNSAITARRQGGVSISGSVVAILDSRHPVSSGRFGQSTDELLYPDNMEVAVEISLAWIQAEIHIFQVYFRIAAICDLPLTLTLTLTLKT